MVTVHTDAASGGNDSQSKPSASAISTRRGFGFTGNQIDKHDLRRRISLPQHLRLAMRRAMETRDAFSAGGVDSKEWEGVEAAEAPMVVFVNSRSGGRHDGELRRRLEELMGEDQVFDLKDIKPNDFVQYGLGSLEHLASRGDYCARDAREKMRVVVAGGDGTVGWVLGSLGELYKQGREPVPPVAVIPLGTGNDLSRSFGWGGSFPFSWKAAVKKSLDRATRGPVSSLDSWHVSVTMPAGGSVELPYALKPTEERTHDQRVVTEGLLPEKVKCFDGVFYNYFSIGMDAQVAYGFHHLRNEKPYLAQGPTANKIIYSGYSCSQGWFIAPCATHPGLRGLRNILRIYINRNDSAEWEQIPVPQNIRSLVCLNLQNYASGRHPWGSLSPEYLEKRGFVEAHADDGLIEIFGLKHGWHASLVLGDLISAKHIAQAAAIRFEARGENWGQSFMQMDGEPWKQPLDQEYSTFLEITRVPHQSLMINGE